MKADVWTSWVDTCGLMSWHKHGRSNVAEQLSDLQEYTQHITAMLSSFFAHFNPLAHRLVFSLDFFGNKQRHSFFFSFPVSFKYSFSLLRIPLWYSCTYQLYIFSFSLSFMLALFFCFNSFFFFLMFLKLSHFCCYPMSSVFTIKRLFAGARVPIVSC